MMRLYATFFPSKVYGCGCMLHFSPTKSMAAPVCYIFPQQSLWLRLNATFFLWDFQWLRLYVTFFPSKVYGCGCMLHFSPAKSMAAAVCYIFPQQSLVRLT